MMARDDWFRVDEGTAEEVPRGIIFIGGGMSKLQVEAGDVRHSAACAGVPGT